MKGSFTPSQCESDVQRNLLNGQHSFNYFGRKRAVAAKSRDQTKEAPL